VVAPRDAQLFSEQNFAFAQANQDALLGLMDRASGADPAGGAAARGEGVPVGVWGRADGSLLDAGDPFHASGAGLETGADIALGSAGRVGAALGYENINLSDSEGGSASQQAFRAGLYGSQWAGSVVFSAAVSYAHAWDKTERAGGVGLSDASRGSDAVFGGVQAAAPLSLDGVSLTPAAGVLVSNVSGGAFNETDAKFAAFAVHGDSTSVTTAAPFAQVSLSHAFTTRDGVEVTPNLLVGYRHDSAADAGGVTLVSEDGTVFAGNRLGLDPNTAQLGAGISAHKDGLTAFVRYRATVASDWRDQTLTAGLRWSF